MTMINPDLTWRRVAITGLILNLYLVYLMARKNSIYLHSTQNRSEEILAFSIDRKESTLGLPKTNQVKSEPGNIENREKEREDLCFSIKTSTVSGYLSHKIFNDPSLLNEDFLHSLNIPADSTPNLQNIYQKAFSLVKEHEKVISKLIHSKDESYFLIPAYPKRLQEITQTFKKQSSLTLGITNDWIVDVISSCGIFREGNKDQKVSAIIENGQIGSLVENNSGSRSIWNTNGIEILRTRYGHLIDAEGLWRQFENDKLHINTSKD